MISISGYLPPIASWVEELVVRDSYRIRSISSSCWWGSGYHQLGFVMLDSVAQMAGEEDGLTVGFGYLDLPERSDWCTMVMLNDLVISKLVSSKLPLFPLIR